MDPLPLLLLFLIVVLGGVIAFFADRLGRKLGKKRLSLFGLRPRHTAELLTVGAGVLIPLLTIIALYALSSDVRAWINEGRKSIKQVQVLREEQKRLEHENSAKAKQVAGLDVRVADLLKSVQDKLHRIGEIETKLTTKSKELERATHDAKLAQANLSARLVTLNTEVRTRRLQLADVKGKYDAEFKKYTATKLALDHLNVSYKVISGMLKDAYNHEHDLLSEIDKLESDKKVLAGDKKRFQDEIDNLRTEEAGLNTKLEKARSDLEEKQQEITRLSATADEIKTALDVSLSNTRFSRLLFPAGAELARVTLGPKQSPLEARGALQNLLSQSRKSADDLGARPKNPGDLSAMIRDLTDRNGHKITAAEQADAIVKAVTSLPDESVLVAYSFWNVYDGESVPLQIRPYHNPIVYRAGDLIAESHIDGRLSDEQIIGQIKDGLLVGIRQRAKKDRMIPTGSDESFGAVTIEQISALVRDLRAENKRVRLQALARIDTRAADQLQLSFRIRR